MPEERVIQVFCDTCSRGVLVWKESMYKCQRCGRQVCQACFDTNERQCIECARPVREAQEIDRLRATQAKIEEHQELERRRRIQNAWTAVLSVVAILAAAALVAWFLLNHSFQVRLPSLPAGRSSSAPAGE